MLSSPHVSVSLVPCTHRTTRAITASKRIHNRVFFIMFKRNNKTNCYIVKLDFM